MLTIDGTKKFEESTLFGNSFEKVVLFFSTNRTNPRTSFASDGVWNSVGETSAKWVSKTRLGMA